MLGVYLTTEGLVGGALEGAERLEIALLSK